MEQFEQALLGSGGLGEDVVAAAAHSQARVASSPAAKRASEARVSASVVGHMPASLSAILSIGRLRPHPQHPAGTSAAKLVKILTKRRDEQCGSSCPSSRC